MLFTISVYLLYITETLHRVLLVMLKIDNTIFFKFSYKLLIYVSKFPIITIRRPKGVSIKPIKKHQLLLVDTLIYKIILITCFLI